MARAEDLIRKYLEGTCTEAEKVFVETFFLSDLEGSPEGPSMERIEMAQGRISARLQSHLSAGRRRRLVRRISVWAAAACVLALVGGGWWYWHRSSVVTTTSMVADVAPGGNKAVLTLAGGKRIVLDSARVGLLVNAGGVHISKVDSGKLAYTGSGSVGFNTLSTPRGGEYQLVLPDGTRVWLNAASSITYPTNFSGAFRQVSMTGEAYFEVARLAGQPFVVHSGAVSIEDLGTGFDVNAYPEEGPVRTTLVEGKVRVGAVVLAPGEQVSEGSVYPVDVEVVTAWKNGAFSLLGVDFGALMRQVSRWYDVDVVYETKMPSVRLGGKIRKNVTLSRLVEALREYGVHVELRDRKLFIMP